MNAPSPDDIRAETITITGHDGDEIEAYRAMPLVGLPGANGKFDVINPRLGPSARVALELTGESALALGDR